MVTEYPVAPVLVMREALMYYGGSAQCPRMATGKEKTRDAKG